MYYFTVGRIVITNQGNRNANQPVKQHQALSIFLLNSSSGSRSNAAINPLVHRSLALMLFPPSEEPHRPLRLRGSRLGPRIGNRVPQGMVVRDAAVDGVRVLAARQGEIGVVEFGEGGDVHEPGEW